MNLIGTMVLFTFGVLHMWQNDQKEQSHYVEDTGKKNGKDKRHFDISFYMGADQAKRKGDAISRLDRLFKITREASTYPFPENTGTVGYKKPAILRILGSKYKFSREDGEKTVVDLEKMTRP